MYHLITDKRRLIDELREEREKNLTLSKELDRYSKVANVSCEDYEEAKIQWEYYKNLYEAEKEDKHNRIRKCFRWIKNIKPSADWEEFRDWVMDDNE